MVAINVVAIISLIIMLGMYVPISNYIRGRLISTGGKNVNTGKKSGKKNWYIGIISTWIFMEKTVM